MNSKPVKHGAAGAFVFTTESPRRVLLIHHRKLGVWMQPGGHVEAWENPLEAAVREVMEETGVNIAPYVASPVTYGEATILPSPKYLLEEKIPAHKDEPEHFHIDFNYVVDVPVQPPSHNERESHGIGWFTLEESSGLPMLENTRTILKQELA